MLEMTIGTLERENVARQNQTDSFDMRNLERNLFQISWTGFILDCSKYTMYTEIEISPR